MTAPPSIDALLGDIVNMAHNAAEGRASPQSLLRYINKRIDEYRAETTTLAPAAPVEDLRAIANEAQFLIDRIRSWADWSLDAETLANEWNGHVDPSLSRLSKLLTTLDKPQGVGDNEG